MKNNQPDPNPPTPSPPWHLICLQAAFGHSLDSLAARFNVSVDEIQFHMDQSVQRVGNDSVRIRSSTQIAFASNRARNDLVSFLQDAIAELLTSTKPRLDQLSDFSQLLNCAARLFAWPSVSISKGFRSYDQSPAGYSDITIHSSSPDSQHSPDQQDLHGPAVNLSLIATPPAQLAKLAQLAKSKKIAAGG